MGLGSDIAGDVHISGAIGGNTAGHTLRVAGAQADRDARAIKGIEPYCSTYYPSIVVVLLYAGIAGVSLKSAGGIGRLVGGCPTTVPGGTGCGDSKRGLRARSDGPI